MKENIMFNPLGILPVLFAITAFASVSPAQAVDYVRCEAMYRAHRDALVQAAYATDDKAKEEKYVMKMIVIERKMKKEGCPQFE